MTDTIATSTNASRQEISPSTPPRMGASVRPAVCAAANVPTVRPSTAGATTSESAARRMGERNALAAPITARAARKLQISGASAHASAAAPKPMYPARTTRRGPSRSATVPEKSWSTANGTMYAVIAAAT